MERIVRLGELKAREPRRAAWRAYDDRRVAPLTLDSACQMAEDYGLNFSFEPSKVVTCAYIKPSFVTYASDPL